MLPLPCPDICTSTVAMSLPGLQLNSIPVEEKTLVIHVLSENTEWRFEVAYGENVQVKVSCYSIV